MRAKNQDIFAALTSWIARHYWYRFQKNPVQIFLYQASPLWMKHPEYFCCCTKEKNQQ
jgi:hypothetical protein